MITPQDIQTKEFSHGVRGYKEDEVDIFLDELTTDYDALINENIQLKAQVEELSSKVKEYKDQEGAVIKTLETAKSLMSDISASAEKRADILIKNAEIDAAAIVREAQDKLKGLKAEEAQITDRIAAYKSRFKSMLEAELKQFASDASVISKKSTDEVQAEKEFADLVNSVPASAEKEFFNDDAFNAKKNDLDHTIVSMRKDIE